MSKLDDLKKQLRSIDSSGFNTAGESGGFQKAWGPMIFRVEQIADQKGVINEATGEVIPDRVPRVRLVALFDQQAFPTNVVTSGTNNEQTFAPSIQNHDPIALSGDRIRKISFNVTVTSIEAAVLVPEGGQNKVAGVAQFVLDPDGKAATLEIKRDVTPGTYDLLFDVTLQSGKVIKDAPVRLKVSP